MSFDFFAELKPLLSDSLIGSFAAKTDENDLSIRNAMQQLAAAGALAMANKAASARDTAFSVAQNAEQQKVEDNLLRIANATGDWKDKIQQMVAPVFGNTEDAVVAKIAAANGLKESSVLRCNRLIFPLVAGILGKYAKGNKMNAGDLASYLGSAFETFKAGLPSSIPVSELFTAPKVEVKETPVNTEPAQEVKQEEPVLKQEPEKIAATVNSVPSSSLANENGYIFQLNERKRSGSGILKWSLILLLFAGLGYGGWWLWQNYLKAEFSGNKVAKVQADSTHKDTSAKLVEPATAELTGHFDSVSQSYIYDVGEMIEMDLPNGGGKIKIGKNSSEKRLLDILNNANWKAPETPEQKSKSWLHFDRVFFKSGYYDVTAESLPQLQNLVNILKAYPSAIVKIGGYTDNFGDSLTNKMLSTNRANMIRNRIIGLGIPENRIGAEGFGHAFPVCAQNNTPACRAQNRRVDFRVVSK